MRAPIPGSARTIALVSCCTTALIFTACSNMPWRSNRQPYAPAFKQGAAYRPDSARGTLKGDFDWAARSTTLVEAKTRWNEFLRSHRPANGEYEDAFAAMHVRAAELELVRVHYLLGDRAEGDALLRRLDPLGIDGSAP